MKPLTIGRLYEIVHQTNNAIERELEKDARRSFWSQALAPTFQMETHDLRRIEGLLKDAINTGTPPSTIIAKEV